MQKQHRVRFRVGKHYSKQTLKYVHSDLWGPSRTYTHGGNLYFLFIVDDFSRLVWVYHQAQDSSLRKVHRVEELKENLMRLRPLGLVMG